MVFYAKEGIVCLGLQNGNMNNLIIFKLLIENTSVSPQTMVQANTPIDFKNFSLRDKTIAEAQFICSGDSDRSPFSKQQITVVKKVSIVALLTLKLCQKLKSMALNS